MNYEGPLVAGLKLKEDVKLCYKLDDLKAFAAWMPK